MQYDLFLFFCQSQFCKCYCSKKQNKLADHELQLIAMYNLTYNPYYLYRRIYNNILNVNLYICILSNLSACYVLLKFLIFLKKNGV